MPTDFPDLFTELARPFPKNEVKVRAAPGGRQLSYITARQVANRLDEVLGPENWWDEYHPLEHSVICKLSILLPNGRVLTKADAGGYAGMKDEGDDEKSGFSDAFKRAAVKFGLGRFLYGDGIPTFTSRPAPALSTVDTPASASTPGRTMQAYLEKHGRVAEAQELAMTAGINRPIYLWTEAQCKVIAGLLRANAAERKAEAEPRAEDSPAKPSPDPPAPIPAMPHFENGHAFYKWVKGKQEETDIAFVPYLNAWAKEQGFRVPDKMLHWSDAEIALGYAEVMRKMAAMVTPPQLPLSTVDTPVPAPAYDPDFEKGLRQMQELLLERCKEIAVIQKPGMKITGDSIRLVATGLQQLVPHGKPLATIRGCRDLDLLGDYLTEAEKQLDRLHRQSRPLSAPTTAPVLPFIEPQGVVG